MAASAMMVALSQGMGARATSGRLDTITITLELLSLACALGAMQVQEARRSAFVYAALAGILCGLAALSTPRAFPFVLGFFVAIGFELVLARTWELMARGLIIGATALLPVWGWTFSRGTNPLGWLRFIAEVSRGDKISVSPMLHGSWHFFDEPLVPLVSGLLFTFVLLLVFGSVFGSALLTARRNIETEEHDVSSALRLSSIAVLINYLASFLTIARFWDYEIFVVPLVIPVLIAWTTKILRTSGPRTLQRMVLGSWLMLTIVLVAIRSGKVVAWLASYHERDPQPLQAFISNKVPGNSRVFGPEEFYFYAVEAAGSHYLFVRPRIPTGLVSKLDHDLNWLEQLKEGQAVYLIWPKDESLPRGLAPVNLRLEGSFAPMLGKEPVGVAKGWMGFRLSAHKLVSDCRRSISREGPLKIGGNRPIRAVQLQAMDLSRMGGSRFRRCVLGLLACLAILEFSMRGPVRALEKDVRSFNDFVSPYEQTRAWISGRDPYAPIVLKDLWPTPVRPHFVVTESLDGTLPAKRGIPSPYLTTAFPLLLPIAELPWKIAVWVWAFMCVLGVFVVSWVLIHLAGARRYSSLGLMIFISVLLLAPMHTAIATSNIVTIAFALGMVATFCLTQNRSRMAGVLLTFAIALKPTVALPFLIYALVHRNRVKVMAPAIATGILLLSVAIIPHHGRTLWWPSFLANNQCMFAPGAIDDFSTANPLHFQLVNLQVALFPILQNRTLAQVTAALIFVTLLALWLFAVRRDGHLGLLDLAILTSASLLPVYHRFTDAGLLLVPVVWALSEMKGELRSIATACLLLASPFLVPGATILHEFSGTYETIEKLSRSRFWDSLLLPHEAWLILVICVVLVTVRFLPRGASVGAS